LDSCKDIIENLVETTLSSKETEAKAMVKLKESLQEQFHYLPLIDETSFKGRTSQEIVDDLFKSIQNEVLGKVAITGAKPFNDFLRFQYLRQIDIRWQEHLEQLEALREAVYLRSYAQRNPLLEYKLEGFEIFDNMIDDIKRYIATMMVRVQIRPADVANAPRRQPAAHVVESHNGAALFAGNSAPQRSAGGQQGPVPVQVRRTTEKVGRNDPCPCGSGKKYKYCHGRDA
jgi:preprotein translocase subunit SecA